MEEFPEFDRIIKQTTLKHYIYKIRMPLMDQKKQDIENYDQRCDYQQVLTLRNYDDREMATLVEEELVMLAEANSELKRLEKVEDLLEV